MEELIKRILSHVEEVGECWEWVGAVQSSAPTPMMRWAGSTKPVRRIIAQAQGKQVHGRLATCKCRNELCVNPEHVVVVTRQRLQELIAKERNYQATNFLRIKKLSDNARLHAKLTVEIAQEIRDADGTQRQIAARFGVTQATVSRIRRGETWRDYSNPFSALMKGKK